MDSTPTTPVADPTAWSRDLITKDGRLLRSVPAGESFAIKNCEANVFRVLVYSPPWRQVVRLNEVTKEVEIHGGPLGATRPENLDTAIAVSIQQGDWGRLGLMPKPAMVRELLASVAAANAYDPLREYLEALKWNGTPRIDAWLEDYLGAEGDPAYLRAVGPKWLLSAVARGYQPGCKVDTVLILEGPQGLLKSSALKTLGYRWFSDAPIDVGNKDSWALVGQRWIIEFGELETVRCAADVNALKSFLSRAEDQFRPPYGRVNLRSPRRAVFAGTTNSSEYLRNDPSGYRRFWPVKCTHIDLRTLMLDRDQLWAEAVVRYKAGEKWWLTEAEAAGAEIQAAGRAEEAAGPDAKVLEWILRLPPERRVEVTSDQACAALELPPGAAMHRTRIEVGAALRRLGYERLQRRVAGTRLWIFRAPESILTASQTKFGELPRPLSLVPSEGGAP
jgi:predicted P-loop ATPase